MPRIVVFALIYFVVCSTALWGQCPTIAEINQRFYPDKLEVGSYEDSLANVCPTYRDSLQKALYSLSILAYVEGRDLRSAVYFGERALDLKRTLLAGQDPTETLGKCLHNLGIFTHNLGRYREAEAYLREAIEVYETIDHAERRMRSLAELGFVYGRMGDYDRSSEILMTLIRDGRKLGADRHVANGLRLLGQNLVQQKHHAAARDTLTNALAIYTILEDGMNIARTHLDLAGAAYGLKDYASVEQNAAAALAIFSAAGVDREVAKLQSLLALSRSAAGDETGALAAWNRNLDYVSTTGDPVLLAQAYDNGAELAAATGDYELAISRVGRAIGALVGEWTPSQESPVPTREDLLDNPYLVDLFIYLGDLARMYRLAGRSADALSAIYAADGVLDALAREQGGTVGKLFWREQAMPVYELAIAICREEAADTEAFLFFEKSRALLLLEAWAEADLMRLLPPELGRSLDSANRVLLGLQRTALTADAETLDSLRKNLIQTRSDINALQESVQRTLPAYATQQLAPTTIDEAAAREDLSRGNWDRQLQYFFGDERVYALALSGAETMLHDLGNRDAVEKAVRQLLYYFTGSDKIDQDPAGFLAHSHTVYRMLLAPLELQSGERLLVIPDGILAYLPFAALVTEGEQGDLGAASYLVRNHLVSYAQSATLLQRQQLAPASSPNVLAFAPFVATGRGEAPALPFSEQEITTLERTLGAELLLNDAATREQLLARMTDYGTIHLSSHAYANPEGDSPPRILTATEPVYLPDVYAHRLDCGLVTLSACQSNIGPLARGEGVLGLGRAFAAAGARGVVASLWTLNDRAAAAINEDFYAALKRGAGKPDALHEAQLKYLDRSDMPAYLKSPYYWAGLTYYGSARGIERKTFPWPWIGLAGLLVAGWWLWRKNGPKGEA
ncbi:CHAT domain-containing protein [Lewinella sp. W8]|uniref:CHAT domain-containing protein n=1 Tax=Lewinella sp. W8 TaxID=2528208 RepID=UPI001067DFAE|nr:CHAT domain-containing protein [Lewinella sp. W8]MTB50150.1 CHAT domain-containing protein [Lewinella sp. W8]